ncbi:hypothetical protein LTR05_000921 [Lithohypha guttulata]|uniref:MICOS complex subunit MIC12 n=1 Tax=Lithohypha guttulata TaxID=1690604 RepID=A0AAN7T6X4_9EURO|nr:hypothetical protein LTR05_000921 [Lithohypha guttulata]
MGFTTGFLGGLTLTYSLIYLSVYVHRSNRTHQSLLLRQQAKLLNSSLDPAEPEYEPPAYRVEKAGLEEQIKDRWNRGIEEFVRRAQGWDLEATRLRIEDRIGNTFNKVKNTERAQELQQTVKEQAHVAEQKLKEAADILEHRIEEGTQKLNEKVKESAQDLQKLAKEGAHMAKEGAQDLQKRVQEGIANAQDTKESLKHETQVAVHGKRLLEL